ncbi:MAG: DUF4350 domain-containing protein [Reichenbachiella sp.]|uniref:DUF4350 domain-containing protein n=1 Tax=Reichenbachiella sp. TaxID=2184521 RepID=UPI003298B03D
MWDKYKYYIWPGVALVAIGLLESMKPKESIWLESYSKFDKIPYGNYILYHQLEDIFTAGVEPSFESLSQSLDESITNTNLIIINNVFEAERYEIEKLLNFVNNGNQAMIISRQVSDLLLDTLGLGTNFEYSSKIESDVQHSLSKDTARFNGPSFNIHFKSYFDSLSTAQPLGYRSDSLVNFVGLKFGMGQIFIHVHPSAFTNAFILTAQNDRYIQDVLSFLPDQPTIWDEYYKARKNYIKQTPFQQILTTDGLRQALYLALATTLIYMIFYSKRKQRIIPVLVPKSNATVEFIETMGQLYYNESDHKDIGMKRISFFLSEIREKYRIDTTQLDATFSHKVSSLSGVSKEIIDQLIINFNVIKTVDHVLPATIIEQDELLKNYYKKERKYGK